MIRVLIVDDHELLAQSLVRLLSDVDEIDVIGTASSGEEGVRRAIFEEPDVVLMDFAMPGMNGAQAARRIVDAVPHVAVVLLTGSENPGSYYASMMAGCSAWITKTRAVHELVDVIRRVHSGERFRAAAFDAEMPPLDELIVEYQPVVEIESHLVVGFEALVRWNHPVKGVVAPGYFLPHAEASGYIVDIDRRVFQIVQDDIESWGEVGGGGPTSWVSVNLSAVSLSDHDVVSQIVDSLTRHAIAPGRLAIEVTETAMLADIFDVEENIRLIERSGFKLALDDFGTAFAAMSYLRRFNFDKVKVDRSFVMGLPEDQRCDALVRSIHSMASSLHAETIAEGVENTTQCDVLLEIGVELAQGFLFSHSVSFELADEIAHQRGARL